MKISLNWLADFVDVSLDARTLAQKLAMIGLPVESITRIGDGFSGVIVAEVKAKAPHPKAEKLTLVQVWDGTATHDVVCGASNVPAPGGKVLWARPGSKLPGPDGKVIEIGSKELRGVKSAGMLCSESELGLAGTTDGIIVLTGEDAAAAPGATAQSALGLDDTVLDVELTPNRGDCLSHLGLAREIAALTGAKLRRPDDSIDAFLGKNDVARTVSVVIDDATGCTRYTARLIEGVKIGPSPRWMRRRLEAVGVRPISNLVDITNYVMFELGQPLHAFDSARVAGPKIRVRRAKPGERMKTLDDQERVLEPTDLLICDDKGPVALAGVMGGQGSEVEDSTTSILLEAAAFAPTSVRRTARRLQLSSESSHRFERGVDQASCERASRRAARLFAELAGGTIARGVVDVEPAPKKPVVIDLRPARLEALLGFAIPTPKIVAYLGALGIESKSEQGGALLRCTPPSHRLDLELEVDLIEEAARLHGYEHIPATLPTTQARPRASGDATGEAARDALVAAGMLEAQTYGFTSPARLAALRFPEGHPVNRPIPLKNPLREEQSVMRTSLLANLLAALAHNLKHGATDVRLFEVGNVFLPSGQTLPDEPRYVAGVLCGERAGHLVPAGPYDFFDVRGVLERLFAHLRLPFEMIPARSEEGFLHPGVAAAVRVDDQHVGVVGEIHPEVRDRFGIERTCFGFELNLSRLPAARIAKYEPIDRFPSVGRDVSFFVDDFVPAERVRQVILDGKEPLLRDVRVLEDYREAGRVPQGKKGMLWSMTYRASDRTLTDAEVDAAHERLVATLLSTLKADRR
jgi:phenylalanyl-tRNA synthetase beta chain